MFWIIVIILLVAFIAIGSYGSRKLKKAREIEMRNNKLTEFIVSGKYVAGHPDIERSIQSTEIGISEDKVLIYDLTDLKLICKGEIAYSTIKTIVVEDASIVEKRITATRLFAVGLFAFALKKKSKDEIFYTIITIGNGRFENEVLFEFVGKESAAKANKLKNALIKQINSYEKENTEHAVTDNSVN